MKKSQHIFSDGKARTKKLLMEVNVDYSFFASNTVVIYIGKVWIYASFINMVRDSVYGTQLRNYLNGSVFQSEGFLK